MSMGAERFYWAEQVREVERRGIAAGTPAYAMMQRAAAGAWSELTRAWPAARRIAIVCGPGNNGGDGFELARLAREAGCEVGVWETGTSKSATAGRARKAWLGDGGKAAPFRRGCLKAAEVVVDAIFGIGLSRAPVDRALAAIAAINAAREAGAGVIALDVPSGLDGDRGSVPGDAVIADLTVSFIARKPGLYTGAGPDFAGEVRVDGLDLPSEVFSGVEPVADGLGRELLAGLLPRRRRTAHKGDNGHVLVVGGDAGMGGAALLAARAALHSGAGLVSVATHPGHAAALMAAQPELMVHGVDGAAGLRPLLEAATVLAVGPGLGRHDWGRSLWCGVAESTKPMVVDADALNWLAEDPRRNERWVLTPHPGEAGRLLASTTARVQEDRFATVKELVGRYGGVAILKGAGTLVRGTSMGLCALGTPAMAVGGMGDVLCGIVAALQAQGMPAESAARAATVAHALAAEQVAGSRQRGILPSGVVGHLPRVLNP